ncbi:MAG TPA: glycosyltransferase family 2 protein [Opitutaceae bacterium]|nr:glycosyltransferase family 2 protein [Opitutaceae bacterium]
MSFAESISLRETKRPVVSIVSPVYRAATLVDVLVKEISNALAITTLQYEIILIDDGSPDNSWQAIADCAARDRHVVGIKLTRNFGQQQAITAGIEYAQGDYIVVMDCDLQDDPEFIPSLVERAKEGFDVVYTRKNRREYGTIRNALTHVFYSIFHTIGDVPGVNAYINGYVLITRRVAQKYLELKDCHRDFLMLIQWLGFRSVSVDVIHRERYAGGSSYSFKKLLKHALSLITIHSKTLLMWAIAVGFLYVVGAIIYTTYLIIGYFSHGYRPGWASTMVAIIASTGFILLGIGVLGIYLGHIFDQTRARPLYIVQQTLNTEAQLRDLNSDPS